MASCVGSSHHLPSFQEFVRQTIVDVSPSPLRCRDSPNSHAALTLQVAQMRPLLGPTDSSKATDSSEEVRRKRVLNLQDCVVGLPESVVKSVPQQFQSGMVMMKKRRARKYKNAIPSSFCHHCARKSPTSYVTCSNNKRRTCLKIVCKGCFDREGWDFEHASDPASDWICFHCRGACPERALCSSYDKANRKRNLENHIRKFRANEGHW